jgi:hypothetical protein
VYIKRFPVTQKFESESHGLLGTQTDRQDTASSVTASLWKIAEGLQYSVEQRQLNVVQ